MSKEFKVGDPVMMLDGPKESKKIGRKDYGSLWNEPCMRKLVGQVGVVRFVYTFGVIRYVVTFPKDVDEKGIQWYCYAEWLSEVPTLTESDELDAMFDDLGGAE